MKKNNMAFIITATAFVTISTSIQGMEREKPTMECEKQIILSEIDSKDVVHAHIETSPKSQRYNIITTYSHGPSIMTALYVKYNHGEQFAGTTCCSLEKFISDFPQQYAPLEEICHKTTKRNNIEHIKSMHFWLFRPYNLITILSKLSDHDNKTYSQNVIKIFTMLDKHYTSQHKTSTHKIFEHRVTQDYHDFEGTNRSKMEVILYPGKGTIQLNDEKINLFDL